MDYGRNCVVRTGTRMLTPLGVAMMVVGGLGYALLVVICLTTSPVENPCRHRRGLPRSGS